MKRFEYSYINFRFTYEDFHTVIIGGQKVNLDLNPQFNNPITFDMFMQDIILNKINEQGRLGYELELIDMEKMIHLYNFHSTMTKDVFDVSFPQIKVLFKKEIIEF